MLAGCCLSRQKGASGLFVQDHHSSDTLQTLECISDLFGGAKGIQTWLNLCARLIAKSIPADRIAEAMEAQSRRRAFGPYFKPLPTTRLKKEQMTSVVWTTPLGLPIVQPYRKTKRKQIMTSLQTVFISDPNSPAEGSLTCYTHAPKLLMSVY